MCAILDTVNMNDALISGRRKNQNMKRVWGASIFVIVALGVSIPEAALHAESTIGAGIVTTMLNYLMLFISVIQEKILYFLGQFIILLIELIIRVSQYNTFIDAQPVVVGWPLARDLVNMFFIVILLLVAFSTIVRWKKFPYKEILPKLLLMAVLVNFSKTIVGLLIDVSQVIMLTFVNGFKPAAAGNFVTIFKLDKVMKMAEPKINADRSSASDPMLVNIVLAQFFATLVLGIAAALMAIMVVYLVARVVGLWFALIMSPIAFFMTAVPSALKGKVSSIGGDYWDKLSALLSGGPIMAFFLWLTLATAQNVGSIGSAPYAGAGDTAKAMQYFGNAIGSSEQFGGYLVAVVMLFLGLEAAVSSSQKISSTAGRYAGKIKDIGTGATKWAAYGGMAAGGAWVAKDMGRRVDRTVPLTKWGGNAMQSIGSFTGIRPVMKAGTKLAGTRGRAVEKEAKDLEEATKGMSVQDAMRFAERDTKWSRSNADRRKAATAMLAKLSVTKEGGDLLKERFVKEGIKKGFKEGSPELEAYAAAATAKEQGERHRNYEKSVEGDDEKVKKAKEMREKRPSLDKDAFGYTMNRVAEDPTNFGKIAATELESSDVVLGAMAASGMYQSDGLDKDNFLAKKMSGSSKQARILSEMNDQLEGAAQRQGMTVAEVLKDIASAESDSAKLEKQKKYGITGGRLAKSGTSPHGWSLVGADALAGNKEAPALQLSRPARDEGQIRQRLDMIDVTKERLVAAQALPVGSAERIAEERSDQDTINMARRGAMHHGASVEEAYGIGNDGRFENDGDRGAFRSHMGKIYRDGARDVQAYANVNLASAVKDGEVRQEVVSSVNVGQLSEAFREAGAANNIPVLRTLSDLVHAVDAEGDKVEHALMQKNKERQERNASNPTGPRASMIDLNQVREAARTNDVIQLQTALGDAYDSRTSMRDAQALQKRAEIHADPNARRHHQWASKRSREAMSRGKGKT